MRWKVSHPVNPEKYQFTNGDCGGDGDVRDGAHDGGSSLAKPQGPTKAAARKRKEAFSYLESNPQKYPMRQPSEVEIRERSHSSKPR